MFDTWMGTVGLVLLLLVAIWAMLRVAKYALRKPTHVAPHEVADALGRLSAERVAFVHKQPTLTDKERHEAKVRLHLVSARARGRARIATFPDRPKGAA